ncbi:hypothetical protein HDU67_001591 [Dinochytrium kinnereticum]|nr:hypothetical protein HDU67_001591 [Dinochytrium kinnereticum]
MQLALEKLAWKEKEKLAGKLEGSVARLSQDVGASQAENARLRKQNDDLQRRLDQEMMEFSEARQRWMDKEQALLVNAKADRVKLKELRDLYNVREHKGYEHAEEPAPLTPDASRDSSPFRTEAVALAEENLKLKAHIQTLTTQMGTRDLQVRKQERDILELQRTVEALMDEIELGQENAQFLSSVMEDRDLSDLNVTPPSPPMSHHAVTFAHSEPSSDSEEDPALLGGGGGAQNRGSLSSAKSLNSLAEEYRRMNEVLPDAVAVQPSLRAKCAALGLSTEGNRAILKKRLMRHAQKKKKQAEKGAPSAA